MASELSPIERASQDIGRRLRLARTSAGMKLSTLAEKTKLSEAFLSRLERGQVSSSIANLIQITEVLGLGLHDLFAAQDTPAKTSVAVHHADTSDMAEIAATGYRWRHLAGGAPLDRMEMFHLILPRRERMQTMVSHPGQEYCYVMAGEVLFYVGEQEHRLRAGEGIFLDSALPHRAENAGKGEAHILMVVSKTPHDPVAFDWWRPPDVPASRGTLPGRPHAPARTARHRRAKTSK
ncbi:cupin domain-containing protein [Bradyrhizobium erythrophlei]|uniref:cupin domain-containing protein n=1 Tax=Bradyrhizobium erythrophlei TaxID=1437360 RepID=UPI0035EDF715